MENKLTNIYCDTEYSVDESFNSEKFIKMRLRICHDGVNPNHSNLHVDTMQKEHTVNSLKNTPILANVLFDENGEPQFNSHDMELEIDKTNPDNVKMVYQETPIGVIPETNNYEIAEFNGRNYVFSDAYIWKNYSNYAQDIIERDEDIKLSMEIAVNDYSYNNKADVYTINDYDYTGITYLNSKFGTGMLDALATTTTFEKQKAQMFSLMTSLKEEINRYSSIKGENNSMTIEERDAVLTEYDLKLEDLTFSIEEDMTVEAFKEKIEAFVKESVDEQHNKAIDEIVAEFNLADDSNFNVDYSLSIEDFRVACQEYVQVDELEAKKTVLKSYALTYKDKTEKINNYVNSLDNYDCENDVYTYYDVCDYDDNYVYVSEYACGSSTTKKRKGRFAYKIGENSEMAFDSNFEEMFVRWLTSNENEQLEASRNAFTVMQAEFEEYKTKYSAEEFETLAQYKATDLADKHKVEIENVLGEYAQLSKNAEFIALSEKALAYDNVEDLRKECDAILGKTFRYAKAPDSQFIKVPYATSKTESVEDVYGGILAEKYNKKD